MRDGRHLVAAAALCVGAALVACSSDKTEPLGPGDAGDAGAPLDAGEDAGLPPTDAGRDANLPPLCDPPVPPPAALVKMGEPAIAIGGRRREPTGVELDVGGFPVQAVAHPTLPLVYVANTGYSKRALEVVDAATGAVLQDLDRGEIFYGLAITSDGTRLYSGGGSAGTVDAFDVAADGTLTHAASASLGGYPAGVAVSPDGTRLWVAEFRADAVDELDAITMTVLRRVPLAFGPYQLALLPGRHELWATGFSDTRLAVVDTTAATVLDTIEVGSNPVDLAVTADETRVFTAAADGEEVLAIDTATRAIVDRARQADPSLVDAMGEPLPATSPTGLELDEAGGRIYVARAADDVVAVLDATTLDELGLIPVGWYPTDVALTADRAHLVVTNGKGLGTGPLAFYRYGDSSSESGKRNMRGSVSVVALGPIDATELAALTTRARAGWMRPDEVFPFDCAGTWPVPSTPGRPTPIEHIVLIVRENKTYDSVLGDLGTGDGDPTLVLYDDTVTPNLHALARQFTNADNFYSDGETSVQGHFWLTSSFVNDYLERTWIEDYRGHGDFGMDAVKPEAEPDLGTFFTHLLRHGVDFRIYGEIVGSDGEAMGQLVSRHIDTLFPGTFFNTDVADERKALYVASQIVDRGVFPPFVYVLLPNDHTNGLRGTELTPESLISDNDYGTGILVDAISHSRFWDNTAIFITEDDTQIGADHVDYHRNVLVVASPWARHAATTSVHTSFPSLFRTFEHILGLPPMNRLDARATPLYDAFTDTPDFAPYDARERMVPDIHNDGSVPTPRSSGWRPPHRNDFGLCGPDRMPGLGRALWEARRSDPFPGVVPGDDRPPGASSRGAEDEPGVDDDDLLENDAYARAWQAWFMRNGSDYGVLPRP